MPTKRGAKQAVWDYSARVVDNPIRLAQLLDALEAEARDKALVAFKRWGRNQYEAGDVLSDAVDIYRAEVKSRRDRRRK